MQITSHRLQVASRKLQVTSHKLQAICNNLQISLTIYEGARTCAFFMKQKQLHGHIPGLLVQPHSKCLLLFTNYWL
jgi:hypothetical protein